MMHPANERAAYPNRFVRSLVEAGWLILAACVLSLGYAAISSKSLLFQSGEPAVLQKPVGASTFITLQDAEAMFRSGDALFVDARHAYDFTLGHIAGAISIPLNEYDEKKGILNELKKVRLVVTYCDGEECNSSVELASKLIEEGFVNVRIFFGGWNAWKERNLPMEASR